MNKYICWICKSDDLVLKKESNIDAINSLSFKITDSNYGLTSAIYCCSSCGFLQCPEINNLIEYYESMTDDGYEDSSKARSIQAKKLIQSLGEFVENNQIDLLDVGAGTGILLEEAKKIGINAEGIEPSKWLYKKAIGKGHVVYDGILPHPDIKKKYNIITLIDVIEHVDDPVGLLRTLKDYMLDGGVGILVTPDVNSLVARLLGNRWWHYRVAHVGYFSEHTIKLALLKAGFRIIKINRPWWYFPLDYLIERTQKYTPLKFKVPACLRKVIVPINFFDSIAVIFVKA